MCSKSNQPTFEQITSIGNLLQCPSHNAIPCFFKMSIESGCFICINIDVVLCFFSIKDQTCYKTVFGVSMRYFNAVEEFVAYKQP